LLPYTLLAGAVAITLEQKQHKERESEMKGDKRTLKIEIKEMELAHEEMVKNLKKVNHSMCMYQLVYILH